KNLFFPARKVQIITFQVCDFSRPESATLSILSGLKEQNSYFLLSFVGMIMPYQTLNCNGKLVSLEHPAVMGIVNINPDSFYAPSRVTAENLILQRVGSMVE